jgi:hypothetical protein
VIGQSFLAGRAALVWAASMAFWPWLAPAASIAPAQARQVSFPIYADGESNAVAVLRADRVAREHRRLGFFQVRLLPRMVVEGARLELATASLDSNVLARVQAGLEPLAGKVPFEFRGFQMIFSGETTPRLSARLVRPAPSAAPASWILEDVTFRSDHGPVTVRQARLLLEGEPGRLVWSSHGASIQGQLLHGNFITNQLVLSRDSK